MMGIIDDIKKAMAGGGRAANINKATRQAEEGVSTEGATQGNPAGTPVKPTSLIRKKKRTRVAKGPITRTATLRG
jgi:hypothetical protein